MDELAGLRFDELLRRVAEKAPSPGGGSVAGATGALASALGQMVTSYSMSSKTDARTCERLRAALSSLHRHEQIARALITQDAITYEAMTAASKRRAESNAAERAYQEAVLAGALVPMEIAAVSSRALATMDEMKEITNRYLLSDLAIAAVLADAAVRSARYLVRLNAAELTDSDRRATVFGEIDEMVRHCEMSRQTIEAFVSQQLEIEATDNR